MRPHKIKYPDYVSNLTAYEQFDYAAGNLSNHRLRDGAALWASYDRQGRCTYDWDGSIAARGAGRLQLLNITCSVRGALCAVT